MVQQMDTQHSAEKRAKGEYEICAACKGDLQSINTMSLGSYFLCYTCGMPIKHLLNMITDNVVNGIVTAHLVSGVSLKDAMIRAGIRHLDVKRLAEFEAIL